MALPLPLGILRSPGPPRSDRVPCQSIWSKGLVHKERNVRIEGRRGRCAVAGLFTLAALFSPPSVGAQSAAYLDFDGLTGALRSIVNGSDLASMRSLGTSHQGREIWLVEIADRSGPPLEQRPGVLVVGNLSGDHLVGSSLALETLRFLVGADASEADLTEHVIYVVPRLNPDGAEAMFNGPRDGNRLSAIEFDADNDGRMNEDGPEDLNGDGLITSSDRRRFARICAELRLENGTAAAISRDYRKRLDTQWSYLRTLVTSLNYFAEAMIFDSQEMELVRQQLEQLMNFDPRKGAPDKRRRALDILGGSPHSPATLSEDVMGEAAVLGAYALAQTALHRPAQRRHLGNVFDGLVDRQTELSQELKQKLRGSRRKVDNQYDSTRAEIASAARKLRRPPLPAR